MCAFLLRNSNAPTKTKRVKVTAYCSSRRQPKSTPYQRLPTCALLPVKCPSPIKARDSHTFSASVLEKNVSAVELPTRLFQDMP